MSLALAEKRPERPGGWTGIFFQLWDWNRRLTKKKLFSKKLLPPARHAKRGARKFSGDEKMPMAKLLLIADENRGGFPNAKKPEPEDGLGNTMQEPGLVARLMGLESMPTVTREKPRKALDSKFHYSGDKHGSKFSRLDQELSLEAGGLGKIEPRPQKLQKTGGFLDKRQSNAAGACQNAISKNVLSPRARKPHHKLASPVKSPRLLSGSHRARLMQAATKILEPGLQSRSQAKYALTCMGSVQAGMENSDAISKKLNELSGNSLVGSSMSSDNVSELRLGVKESLGSEYVSSSSQLDNAASSLDRSALCKTKYLAMQSEKNQKSSFADQAKVNVRSRAPDLMEKKQKIQTDQDQHRVPQDGMSRFSSKRKNLRQYQLTTARDKVTPESKVCSRKQTGRDPDGLNGPKDFVTVKRSSNYHSRTRSPSKVLDSRKTEMGKNGVGRNMVRKRTSSLSHIENEDAMNANATFVKQRSVRSDLTDCTGTGPGSSRSINRNCVKTELRKEDGHKSIGSKDNGIVSFTFNSPLRHESRPFSFEETTQKSKGHGELNQEVPHQKRIVVDARNENLPFYRTRGDEITNLLEQKIRELTSLDHDESAAKDSRSTASILEELISALTARAPISEEKGGNCAFGPSTATEINSHSPEVTDLTFSQSQIAFHNREFQEDGKTGMSAASLASDTDQPSPISVLEASFSNDSCSVGSPNGSSGKRHSGLTECCYKTQSLDQDIDLLDSATSFDTRESDIQKRSCFFGKDSSKQCTHSSEIGLPETTFSKASQAILNAELLFEHISDGIVESTLETFLVETLETVVSASVMDQKKFAACTRERIQLREFLFDCMIEFLDSKYSRFCTSGYKAWLKRPLPLSRDRLTREVHKEIRGWMYLAGTVLDDMIENELGHSTVKWTTCETETFETGIEIESDILQALVNEMVIDLC